MFQSCRVLIWHEKELLNDGFFSFAVVRQSIRYLPSNTFLKERTLQLSKIPWIFKLKNLSLLVDKNHIVTESSQPNQGYGLKRVQGSLRPDVQSVTFLVWQHFLDQDH